MSSTMYQIGYESIYNLIPTEEVKIETPPRYMSKFRPQVKYEEGQGKAINKTMGPAKVKMPSPEKYLLKHSKAPLPEKKPFSYDDTARKPQVPKRDSNPPMGIHTKKDFIKTNVIENSMAVTKKPQPQLVSTKSGDKQLLENSGLVPKYIKKKDYGETPAYLEKRREETRRNQKEYNDYVRECMRQGAMKQLHDDERRSILQGLKANWGALHHQYQGLSVVTDTTPKKYHKKQLEEAMKQLENDISLMERYKTIYIANN